MTSARTGSNSKGAAPPRGKRRANLIGAAKSREPLYAKLTHTLRNEIMRGVYAAGAKLPTEDELRKRFSVGRHTVREALRQLRQENLISARPKIGTTVAPPRPISDTYVSINDLLTFSVDAYFERKGSKMVFIDQALAAQTGLLKNSKWLSVFGLIFRRSNPLPLCWVEYFINQDFAAVGELLEDHATVFPLIEDIYDQRVVEVQQKITAVLIPSEWTSHLKVVAGSAAIKMRHTFKLKSGKIGHVAITTSPASRFDYSATMRRAGS